MPEDQTEPIYPPPEFRPGQELLPASDGLSPARLQRVLDYVEANLARPLRLEELAGVASLSPFHFSRLFRRAMSVSPVRYVWQRRIHRAKEALARTDTPLSAIAIDCGFASQSHFTAAFKTATGVTPKRFRAALG